MKLHRLLPAVFAFLLLLRSLLGQAITDPFPESIAPSGLTLNLTMVADLPAMPGFARPELNILKPAPDGSGRIFVCDLNGRFWVLGRDTAPSTYLELGQQIGPQFYTELGYGSGFTSFAFHPEFRQNGKFYTVHTERIGGDTHSPVGSPAPAGYIPADFTYDKPPADGVKYYDIQCVLSEWTATDPAADTFVGTRREMMRIDIAFTLHGIQEVAFNPTARPGDADYGLLYVCVGDCGMAEVLYADQTHRLDHIYGSVLRIDPAPGNSANGRYGIPAANPYAADGNPATLGEVYANGFRNCHRISWDTAHPGGPAYVADIGQNSVEELNILQAGADYGWPAREGRYRYDPTTPLVVYPLPADDAAHGYTYPVARFDHSESRSIIGGYVYQGTQNDSLVGHYVFGDLRYGRIFEVPADDLKLGSIATIREVALTLDGQATTMKKLTDTNRPGDHRIALRMGYDEDNNLYLMEQWYGRIYRVTATREPRLRNVSTRGMVQGTQRPLIGGLAVRGGTRATYLVRAVGPELADLGVAAAVANPKLELFDSAHQLLAASDDAAVTPALSSATALVGAFPLAAGTASAALLVELPAGNYTALVTGGGAVEGTAMVEFYEVVEQPENPLRLVNLSSRARVHAGEGRVIGGFVVSPGIPRTYLIRGMGPELAGFGVDDPLVDPLLEVFNAAGQRIAFNRNASDSPGTFTALRTAATQCGAFAFADGSPSAAVLLTLEPGAYTAIIGGEADTEGEALFEVYAVPNTP